MADEIEIHKVYIWGGAPCVFGHPLPMDPESATFEPRGAILVSYLAQPGTGRWGRSLARLVPAPEAWESGRTLRNVDGMPGYCVELITEEIEINWSEDVESTPVVIAKPSWVDKKHAKKSGKKYPFTTMPVGGSFRVPPGDGQPKWDSFRVYCINKGREIGKKFLSHKHEDGSFEVYRSE